MTERFYMRLQHGVDSNFVSLFRPPAWKCFTKIPTYCTFGMFATDLYRLEVHFALYWYSRFLFWLHLCAAAVGDVMAEMTTCNQERSWKWQDVKPWVAHSQRAAGITPSWQTFPMVTTANVSWCLFWGDMGWCHATWEPRQNLMLPCFRTFWVTNWLIACETGGCACINYEFWSWASFI